MASYAKKKTKWDYNVNMFVVLLQSILKANTHTLQPHPPHLAYVQHLHTLWTHNTRKPHPHPHTAPAYCMDEETAICPCVPYKSWQLGIVLHHLASGAEASYSVVVCAAACERSEWKYAMVSSVCVQAIRRTISIQFGCVLKNTKKFKCHKTSYMNYYMHLIWKKRMLYNI